MGIRERLAFTLVKAAGLLKPYNHVPLYMDKHPVYTDWNIEKAIKEGYKAHIYVYACIRLLSRQASSVPWVVWKKQRGSNSKKWVEQPEHQLSLLMSKPNEFHSGQDLMESLVIYLNVGGEAPWFVVEVRGMPVEIWPMQPQYFQPVPSKENYIERYEYTVNEKPYPYPPETILFHKFFDPANPYRGLAPLKAAARIVDTDNEAIDWNKVAMQNRTISDVVFSSQNPMDEDQWSLAVRMVKERYSGKENARRPWVVAGLKPERMDRSPVEMDFIETRKLNREDVCAVFGVPPVLVGVQDKSTYNNYITAKAALWEDNILPFMDDIKSSLNLRLTPRYGDEFYLDYDTRNVPALQRMMLDKAKAGKVFFDMGIPVSQINEKLDLPFEEYEGWDEPSKPQQGITGPIQAEPIKEETVKSHKVIPRVVKKRLKEQLGKITPDDRWNMFVKAIEPREKELIEVLKTLFNQQEIEVINKISKGAQSVDEALFDFDEVIKVFAESVRPLLAKILIEHGKRALTEVAEAGKASGWQFETKEVTFDIHNPNVVEWLLTAEQTFAEHVNETTWNELRISLAEGYEAGESIPDLANRVKAVMDIAKTHRAVMIARTEVVGTSSQGALVGYAQSGVVDKKEWIAARDHRTRHWHLSADGQVVELNDKFVIGGEKMNAPGDIGASAKNRVNCRCTIAPVIDVD
ncbi:MAG: phage portal protein [Thermincolia bacterium]